MLLKKMSSIGSPDDGPFKHLPGGARAVLQPLLPVCA